MRFGVGGAVAGDELSRIVGVGVAVAGDERLRVGVCADGRLRVGLNVDVRLLEDIGVCDDLGDWDVRLGSGESNDEWRRTRRRGVDGALLGQNVCIKTESEEKQNDVANRGGMHEARLS